MSKSLPEASKTGWGFCGQKDKWFKCSFQHSNVWFLIVMFLRLAKDGVVMVLHCSPVDDLLSGDAPCLIIKGGGRRIFYEQQSVAVEALRGCAVVRTPQVALVMKNRVALRWREEIEVFCPPPLLRVASCLAEDMKSASFIKIFGLGYLGVESFITNRCLYKDTSGCTQLHSSICSQKSAVLASTFWLDVVFDQWLYVKVSCTSI